MTTATRTLTNRELTDALEAIGLHEYEIREDYSGRSMYGQACFGVVVEPRHERYIYAALGYAMGYAEADSGDMTTAEALFRDATQDSMGYSVIVYFPGWTLSDDENDK